MIGRDYTFSLNDEEYDKLKAWYEDNIKDRADGNYFGACGGELSFNIIPTSLGDIIIAKMMEKEIVLREI